jgi:hypothetical protein
VPLWRSPTGREPEWVRHAEHGHVWMVTGVVEGWKHDDPRKARGQPVLTERYVIRAAGPLPGRPGEDGRFLLEICSYGHLDGWWIIPLV